MEVTIAYEMKEIFCSTCSTVLGSVEHVLHSDTTLYVNPHAVVHDIICLSHVNGRTRGGRHSLYSWFDGYAWTMFSCMLCNRHIGWRFDRIDEHVDGMEGTGAWESGTHTRPDVFYALTRDGIEHHFPYGSNIE